MFRSRMRRTVDQFNGNGHASIVKERTDAVVARNLGHPALRRKGTSLVSVKP